MFIPERQINLLCSIIVVYFFLFFDLMLKQRATMQTMPLLFSCESVSPFLLAFKKWSHKDLWWAWIYCFIDTFQLTWSHLTVVFMCLLPHSVCTLCFSTLEFIYPSFLAHVLKGLVCDCFVYILSSRGIDYFSLQLIWNSVPAVCIRRPRSSSHIDLIYWSRIIRMK